MNLNKPFINVKKVIKIINIGQVEFTSMLNTTETSMSSTNRMSKDHPINRYFYIN